MFYEIIANIGVHAQIFIHASVARLDVNIKAQ